MSFAFFIASPGGMTLAQTVVDEICGDGTKAGPSFMTENGYGGFGFYITVDGANGTTTGYCLNVDLLVPWSSCGNNVEPVVPPAGASCVASNWPAIADTSYASWIQNSAGAYATWFFTDDVTGPTTAADAMTSPEWSAIEAEIEAAYPGEDAAVAQQAIYDLYSVMISTCSGAAPMALPELNSLGDASGELPTDQELTVDFQTNAGAGVDITISVTNAELVSPASGVATTDPSGMVTVTVRHTTSLTASISAKAEAPLAAGLGVASIIPGEQAISLSQGGIQFVELEASATVEWTMAAATPDATPTETPTKTPVTPTVAPTETPVTPTVASTETPETPQATPVLETPTIVATETPTEAPTETPTEAPTETPTEAPTETTVDTSETPTVTPAASTTGGTKAPGSGGPAAPGSGQTTQPTTTPSTPVAALPSTGNQGPVVSESLVLIAGGSVLSAAIVGAFVFRNARRIQ